MSKDGSFIGRKGKQVSGMQIFFRSRKLLNYALDKRAQMIRYLLAVADLVSSPSSMRVRGSVRRRNEGDIIFHKRGVNGRFA